jgi:hypothetical protein
MHSTVRVPLLKFCDTTLARILTEKHRPGSTKRGSCGVCLRPSTLFVCCLERLQTSLWGPPTPYYTRRHRRIECSGDPFDIHLKLAIEVWGATRGNPVLCCLLVTCICLYDWWLSLSGSPRCPESCMTRVVFASQSVTVHVECFF